ncbi:nitrilase-related carbon-nitrogen hydrolase [Streptomyces otsuchiensis]|uniref:nitrilase-related carbon-nitrogen hydrolase n=1 Tax=Streptomyces otsuchiensis TaxID=2681388 RepID=UPI0010300192|nr:nitrilase-related carbon-nitrogen hydrolase [Streptomyces otsuchiensis]
MTAFVLAGAQYAPRIGEVAANIDLSEHWIREAAAAGARLVVLPEAASAGYVFDDRAEAERYAEPFPGGSVHRAWSALAAELGLWIVGGVTERAGERLYNSAVLVGPHGHAGTYRKAHLWNDEQRIYDRQDDGLPVFSTPLGEIAVGICYDAWFPETFRSAALAGADLLALPANWVPVPGQPDTVPVMADMLCMTGAHSNQMYVAGISRTGTERGQEFIGRSLIAGPEGWPLAGPAGPVADELLLAEVDLIGSRPARHHNPFNQPLADRRTDLYRSGPLARP